MCHTVADKDNPQSLCKLRVEREGKMEEEALTKTCRNYDEKLYCSMWKTSSVMWGLYCNDLEVCHWIPLFFGFKLSTTCVVWSIFWQIVLVNFLQAISSHPIRSQVSKLLALNVVVSSEKINRQHGEKNATGNMAWRIAFWIRDQFGPFLISIFELWTFGKCIITVQAPCICSPV